MKRLLRHLRCFVFGHKALFFVSAMGRSTLTLHDSQGRELVSVHLCRYCHVMFWKRGQDVPADMVYGEEIEMFDARNYVNRMTKAIANEARENGPEA